MAWKFPKMPKMPWMPKAPIAPTKPTNPKEEDKNMAKLPDKGKGGRTLKAPLPKKQKPTKDK